MCAFAPRLCFNPFCLLFFAPLDRVVQGVTPQNTRQVTPTLSTKEPQQVGENDGMNSLNCCAAIPLQRAFLRWKTLDASCCVFCVVLPRCGFFSLYATPCTRTLLQRRGGAEGQHMRKLDVSFVEPADVWVTFVPNLFCMSPNTLHLNGGVALCLTL